MDNHQAGLKNFEHESWRSQANICEIKVQYWFIHVLKSQWMEMKLRFALPQVDTHAHILRLLTEVLNEKKLERGAKMALVVDCWTRGPKELSAIIYYSELVASPLPQDGWSSLSSMASKVHSHSQQLSLRVASKRITSFCRSKFQKKKKTLTSKSPCIAVGSFLE